MSPAEAREFDQLPASSPDSDDGANDDPGGWERPDDPDDGGPEPFYPYPFDPSDCSGAFDGFGVVSDADPGL
jgi:hypothetical protein